MTLKPDEMARLESDALAFNKEHISFLSEASNALFAVDASKDPVIDALALLVGMWRGGFAPRDNQKNALNDVGRWIERRVKQDIRIDAERLRLEIGWLKRLAKGKDAPDRGKKNERRGIRREFGDGLESLRQERDRFDRAPKPPDVDEEPKPPTELPERFEARFVDFKAAREARGNAKRRLRRGREPRDVLLAVLPTDAMIVPLAERLVASTTRTQGFHELFDRVEKSGGRSSAFEVTKWTDDGDAKFIEIIAVF